MPARLDTSLFKAPVVPAPPAPEAPPERPPAPAVPPAEAEAMPARRPRTTPQDRPRAPGRAVPQYRNTEVPQAREPTVPRCYVLDRDHDQALRTRAAATGLTINLVAQQALDALIGHMDPDVLLNATTPPLQAAGDPARPVRRTITIRADQDRVLRVLRLRFAIQASDVVRQAVAAL